MGTFAAGQVVIVHFPFSDLTASKLRPAVVLAEAGRGDWILCQITSKSYGDEKAISLDAARLRARLASSDQLCRVPANFSPRTAASWQIRLANCSPENSPPSAMPSCG